MKTLQTNQYTVQHHQNTFASPQTVLHGLLTSPFSAQNCEQNTQHNQQLQSQANQEIKSLQTQIRKIRTQAVQVQNLLKVRDSLYQQLDGLRQQRQEIEGQIETCSIQQTQTVRHSNYHQMNQRLRRRIYQIREYIQKMSFQNQRIEQGIVTHQYAQPIIDQQHWRRRQLSSQAYQTKRYNLNNFQTMVARLHQKQDQAWRRVRRQEEDIQRRNMQVRRGKTGMTYHSPHARTYYSPGRQML